MKLTITSPQYEDAYDEMTGKCLTNFEADNTVGTGGGGSSMTGGTSASDGMAAVNGVLDGIMAWLGTIPFGNYKHAIDGFLSYVMGLIRGIQDMVQVSDVQNCKLRDPGVAQSAQCACGDSPVQIPDEQAGQYITDHAFWCTGFLRMETPFGTPHFVFNPYSYSALRSAAAGMDAYLACLGAEIPTTCSSLRPAAPSVLARQGAQLLAVLTRCNANYQGMQWDAGAVQIYKDPDLHPCLLYTSPSPRDLSTSRMPSSA